MSGEHDWLAILIQANPKRGLTTREVATKMGCSQRLVQVVVKYFKEHGRSKFFDKINGWKYSEGKHPGVHVREKNKHTSVAVQLVGW